MAVAAAAGATAAAETAAGTAATAVAASAAAGWSVGAAVLVVAGFAAVAGSGSHEAVCGDHIWPIDTSQEQE